MSFDLADYVPANERVIAFWQMYPTGAIATSRPEVCAWRPELLMVQAIVYRSPEDPIPVTAWAGEYVEGRTPFTRGREIENASTSAVSRALGYLGIGISAGIASRDEVAQQREQQETPQQPKKGPTRPVEPVVDVWDPDFVQTAVEAPGDLSEAMAVLEGGAPICDGHGLERVWKTGTGKTGKPWSAWMCQGREGHRCEPLWR